MSADDGCEMETKKMILSRIMKSVRVRRDYEIEIDFTADFEQIRGQDYTDSLQNYADDTPKIVGLWERAKALKT